MVLLLCSYLKAITADQVEGTLSKMEDFYFEFDSDYIVDVFNDGRRAALGTQLAEVFAVKVRASNNCEGVYGSFSVKDGKRTLCYYNRQPEDGQPIDHQDRDCCSLLLSAPHRSVTATPRIEFSLDLKDKNGDEFFKNNTLLPLLMDEEGNVDDVFDKYLFLEVIGRSASATIYYTLPRVAALASFVFELVDESGENGGGHVDVYGNIVARYGNNYDPSLTGDDVRQHFSFLLFQQEDKVQVKYGESIPLLRSHVVVPRTTSIAIEVNLELIHSNGFKEQIKNHPVYFQASQYYGSHIFKLNHGGGSMVLFVDWDAFGSID